MEDRDEFDDLLKAAFEDEPGEGESVLDTIERTSGVKPRVLLRDPPDEMTPVVTLGDRPGDPAAADDRRYQILGEIARGGIGVVLKSRDKDLGRNVALKVLRPEHAGNPQVVHPFVEEALIHARLAHETDPDEPANRGTLAMALLGAGKLREVVKLLEGQEPPADRAVRAFHRLFRAAAEARLGEREKAAASLERATRDGEAVTVDREVFDWLRAEVVEMLGRR